MASVAPDIPMPSGQANGFQPFVPLSLQRPRRAPSEVVQRFVPGAQEASDWGLYPLITPV